MYIFVMCIVGMEMTVGSIVLHKTSYVLTEIVFIEFVACPKCHSIYNLDDVLTTVENVCTYCEYP